MSGLTAEMREVIRLADMPFDGEHRDTRFRCLVWHSEGSACIKCSCGKFVRPEQWDDHRKGA